MSVIALNDVNFDSEVKRSTIPVLVDFYADWCGHCKNQMPVVEDLEHKYSGKIRIAKFDVDAAQGKPNEYGVKGIPALLLFKDGNVAERLVGFHSESQLMDVLKKYV